MTTEFDKQTMLVRVRDSRAAFDQALAEIDAAQRTTPHPPDGWSVQDLLAHITFWEGYALARLREAANGQAPALFGDIDETELNRINQATLDAGRAKSLDAVEADFARVHRELISQIDAMPEDRDDPFWGLWPDDEPDLPWLIIVYNTYDHYDEHRVHLRDWAQSD